MYWQIYAKIQTSCKNRRKLYRVSVAVQKADILVNLIASGGPDMSTAGFLSRAFYEAAGAQLQAVNDQLLLNVSSYARFRSCVCVLDAEYLLGNFHWVT